VPALSKRLLVGLLQAGYVNPEVAARHGDYPELFAGFLAAHPVDLVTHDVAADGLPGAVDEVDGWIVSGSASSVYDGDAWIGDLGAFVGDAVDAGVPLVGICFGHQLLAQVLGGRVEKAPIGWGVGVHGYSLVGEPPPFVDGPVPQPLRLVASHQDQVSVLPADARLWLSSGFCPNAGFLVDDRVLTVQAHPEFDAALSRELISVRRDVIGPERCAEAEATLHEEVHSRPVADWIVGFLRP